MQSIGAAVDDADPSNVPCPTKAELLDFALGRLPAERSIVVEGHVVNCRRCEALLDEIGGQADSLVRGLQRLNSAERPPTTATDVQLLVESVASSGSTESALRRVGGRLGPYEIMRSLGRGGMGLVYQAVDSRSGSAVAIKVLPALMAHQPSAIERFHREFRAIRSLDHENIVHALELGEFEGQPYLVMEYADGCDLAECVRTLGAMNWPEACEVVRQLASGIQYAHEHGLVHRDIKPSNVMLTREGRAIVLDFGLVRLLESMESTSLTASGQVLGTLDYLAPEQLGGANDADARTDIYGLGCTLLTLLSGKRPYAGLDGRSMPERIALITSTNVLAEVVSQLPIPPDLAALLLRMVSSQRDERPPSADAAAQSLAAFAVDHKLGEYAARIPAQPELPAVAQRTAHDGSLSAGASNAMAKHLVAPVQTKGVIRRRRAPLAIGAGVLVSAIVFSAATEQGRVAIDAALQRMSRLLPPSPGEQFVTVKSVLAHGGRVEVHLDGAPSASWVRNIAQLPPRGEFIAQSVDLSDCKSLTDEDMALLARLPKLQRLILNDTPLTNSGLAYLRSLTGLKSLWLLRTNVSDMGMSDIAQLTNLTDLVLNETLLTDKGMKELESLKNLTRLQIGSTLITDESLKTISRFTSLKHLGIQNTKVTSSGLKHLLVLRYLEELDLSRLHLNAESCQYLRELQSLRLLVLNKATIAHEDLETLRGAFPPGVIRRDEELSSIPPR